MSTSKTEAEKIEEIILLFELLCSSRPKMIVDVPYSTGLKNWLKAFVLP